MNKLHLLAASLLFTGFAQADDAAFAVFGPVPESANGNGVEEESLGQPMSCKEARQTAWFIRDLKRTDGETNPEIEPIACADDDTSGVVGSID